MEFTIAFFLLLKHAVNLSNAATVPSTTDTNTVTITSEQTIDITTTFPPAGDDSLVTLSLDRGIQVVPANAAQALVEAYSNISDVFTMSSRRRRSIADADVSGLQQTDYRVVITSLSSSQREADFYVIETGTNVTIPTAAYVVGLLQSDIPLLRTRLMVNGIDSPSVILAAAGACHEKDELFAVEIKLLNISSRSEAMDIVKLSAFTNRISDGLSYISGTPTIDLDACPGTTIDCSFKVCAIDLSSTCDVTITYIPIDPDNSDEGLPLFVCPQNDNVDPQVFTFALQAYIRRTTYLYPETPTTAPDTTTSADGTTSIGTPMPVFTEISTSATETTPIFTFTASPSVSDITSPVLSSTTIDVITVSESSTVSNTDSSPPNSSTSVTNAVSTMSNTDSSPLISSTSVTDAVSTVSNTDSSPLYSSTSVTDEVSTVSNTDSSPLISSTSVTDAVSTVSNTDSSPLYSSTSVTDAVSTVSNTDSSTLNSSTALTDADTTLPVSTTTLRDINTTPSISTTTNPFMDSMSSTLTIALETTFINTNTSDCIPVVVPVEVIPAWLIGVLALLAVLCFILIIILIIFCLFFKKSSSSYEVQEKEDQASIGSNFVTENKSIYSPIIPSPSPNLSPQPSGESDTSSISSKNSSSSKISKSPVETVDSSSQSELTDQVPLEYLFEEPPALPIAPESGNLSKTLPPLPPSNAMTPYDKRDQDDISKAIEMDQFPDAYGDFPILHPADPFAHDRISSLLNDASILIPPNAVPSKYHATSYEGRNKNPNEGPDGIAMPATHGHNSKFTPLRFPNRHSQV